MPAAGFRQESELPMFRWISIFTLIAFVSVSGASAAPSDAAGIDPCRLVTKQEAQAVLGAAVASETSPPARAHKSNVRVCSIQGENGRSLTVFVGSRSQAAFDREKSGQTPVAGIGDDAYAVPPGVVAVRKGETAVTLLVNSGGAGDDAGLLDKVKALARAVAGRL
jgi:hypothetical protein